MPRLAELLQHGTAAGEAWDAHLLFSRYDAALRRSRASSSFLTTSFDGASIDDPPDQQIWPMPVEGLREKDPFNKVMGFLTGHKPKVEEKFGKDAKELMPSVADAHEHANKADEYAVEAQEAAHEAVSWDRGIVRAVNVADEAWDGALYAKRVNTALEKAYDEMEALRRPRLALSKEISEFGRRVDGAISAGSGQAYQLNFPLKRLKKKMMTAGKMIEPVRDNGVQPLLEVLQVEDHPNLFPPLDGPGMKDGAVEVPLHFQEWDQPDPMVLEDRTPPDVQALMPPGSLPLDMSNLKGIA